MRGLGGQLPSDPLEIGAKIRRALIPEIAILLQGREDGLFQFGRQAGAQRAGAWRVVIQNRRGHGGAGTS